jgi:hypothetical protein
MGEWAIGASARLLAGLSREKKKISQKPAWGCICVRSRAPTGKRQKRLLGGPACTEKESKHYLIDCYSRS